MAYFSNGSEGCSYESVYCERCVNYRDKDDGRGLGCPVWDVHLLYAYEEANSKSNAKAMLDYLIPMKDDGLWADECSMFQEDNTKGKQSRVEVLFWVCPKGCDGFVEWDHSQSPSVATCRECGKKSIEKEAHR